MSKTSKSTRKTEPKKRAVLQFRVHQDDYDELAKAARQQHLTISQEAARRLRIFRFWYGRVPPQLEAEIIAPQVIGVSADELEKIVARAVTRGVEQAMTSRQA
jgi:hypothetical protein